MKKFLLIFLFFFNITLYSQEIILSENAKQIIKAKNEISKAISKANSSIDEAVIKEAIEKIESWFNLKNGNEKTYYLSYADLLAKSGNLQKAIEYYEKAISNKILFVENFSNPRRKRYFEKDTVLYNKKREEFNEISINYTAKELKLLVAVKQMLANDQFARFFWNDCQSRENYKKNIIVYADSITMKNLIELIEQYPEYQNPLSVDAGAYIAISRHIFTAYPDFWLTHFEPKERENLLIGKGYPKGYARTYDRCMITSGKAKYSFYGEWDDDGKAANPDKESVNKRRANLGLPPLEERVINPKEFFLTY